MSKSIVSLIILSSFLLVMSSCEEVETTPALVIPTDYDGASFESNAATELAVREALSMASSEMKRGRTGNEVSQEVLFSALEPVLSVTSQYYADLVTEEYVPGLVGVSGGQSFVLGESGGTLGAYLFTKDAIENEQLVEKGLFGAALYNHAASLLSGNLTVATSDQALAAFGAHPDFPSSNNGNLHENPDGWMANYTARRDKNEGNGLYSQIKTAFITLQAATKGGSDFLNQQNQAAADILSIWEKANAATVINYLHAVISKLSATNVDDDTKGSAMHSFSEAVGFLHGFKSIPQKQISDSKIDEVLALMNVPVGALPTTLNILTQPDVELQKLVSAIAILQNEYGFSDQEIEDFKKNWVNEQNR